MKRKTIDGDLEYLRQVSADVDFKKECYSKNQNG